MSYDIKPKKEDILESKKLKVDCIELHTGKFCNKVNQGKNYKNDLKNLKKAANYAKNLNLEVHAGHGLNFKSTKILSKIDNWRCIA